MFRRKQSNSKKKEKLSSLPSRINIIFVVAGILFVALMGQLAYLQVIQGNKYEAEVNRADTLIMTGNVQRGMVYDSLGRVLVGNKVHQAIVYTKGVNVLSTDMYKAANKLARLIKVPTDSLTERQKADYYLADVDHLKQVISSIPNANMYNADSRYDKAIELVETSPKYRLTKAQKNAATIFAKMSGAYQLSTVNIKTQGVTQVEIARVGEHLSEIPGVNVGTSWSRNYPNGTAIQGITGTVSNEKTGLPSDRVNELLAQGYSRNDGVGQSYLERQYESVLRGSKSQTQLILDSKNKVTKQIKRYGGQKGDNLQLTINSVFQKHLQQLVRNAGASAGGYSTGVYAVAMNPKNGSVLGIAGVDRNPSTGKITDNTLGPVNNAIVMGSVVKGAMISGALMDKVITPTNSVLVDAPIVTGGTKKASWFNANGGANTAVDAAGALEISSNSYMMQLAMKEARFNYVPGGPLTMSPAIFDKMRGYFSQFGLGIKTGIDIPGETTGLKGASDKGHIGSALDLSFGNYDAYTTIQVAQYMSTVANGGYRIQPHVVQAIRGTTKDGKLGAIKNTIMPKVLNYVDMTPAERAIVKRGFYQVVHGSNPYKTGDMLASVSPSISAKTGTAQTFYKGSETVTLSLASYAPSDDPQVVVALAMPNLGVNADSNNMQLAKQIYRAYWKDIGVKSAVK